MIAGRTVDSSLLAAWCFGESLAKEAEALMRDSDLYAPPLLAYELTSIARKKSVNQPDAATTFWAALQEVLELPIHWFDVDHLAVLRIALEHHISSYDACYIFVARSTGTPLLTFDDRLKKVNEQTS